MIQIIPIPYRHIHRKLQTAVLVAVSLEVIMSLFARLLPQPASKNETETDPVKWGTSLITAAPRVEWVWSFSIIHNHKKFKNNAISTAFSA